MLSDTLFEAIQAIWEGVNWYDYCSEYETQIKASILELSMIIEDLDHPILEIDGQTIGSQLTREQMMEHINTKWAIEYNKRGQ